MCLVNRSYTKLIIFRRYSVDIATGKFLWDILFMGNVCMYVVVLQASLQSSYHVTMHCTKLHWLQEVLYCFDLDKCACTQSLLLYICSCSMCRKCFANSTVWIIFVCLSMYESCWNSPKEKNLVCLLSFLTLRFS